MCVCMYVCIYIYIYIYIYYIIIKYKMYNCNYYEVYLIIIHTLELKIKMNLYKTIYINLSVFLFVVHSEITFKC